MTARARSQLARWRAQAEHTAPSPIGCAKGSPQTAHHGGAKKLIDAQHCPHKASGSPTTVPQARQRGGMTPSTTRRPIRRSSHILVEGQTSTDAIYTADELFRGLEGEDAIVIAHVGGRYADLKYAHDGRLERAVEVHSTLLKLMVGVRLKP